MTTKKFDLEERSAKFGESVITFLKTVPQDSIRAPLISQVVRSSSSIGANYGEADCSGTKKEFKYRISLCAREAKETKHWLRMLAVAIDETKTDDLRLLWKEADELNRIFSTIHQNTKLD